MFTDKLLQWFEENQRTLPWRGEEDPYKIWVSEIILQQTRVQQGWDYYLRFIQAFPDVKTLANATEEQVLRLWQGLGYYSRARNMHVAAQQIMSDFDGKFPNTYEDIRKLKGIGDYTAAAISSMAFQLPYPAVDGNVLRIISRIFGVTDDISETETRHKITEICQKHIDQRQPGLFNQACMDFGSLICTPKNPLCDSCPFKRECYAYGHQLTELLPIKNNKIKKKERHLHFVCTIQGNNILLEKRTRRDIWQNMYQFPLVETENDNPIKKLTPIENIKEVLTHQIIFGTFYINIVKKMPQPKADQIVIKTDEMSRYPMPKIMLEFLKKHPL